MRSLRLPLLALAFAVAVMFTGSAEQMREATLGQATSLALRMQYRFLARLDHDRTHLDGLETRWTIYQAAVSMSLRAAGIEPVSPIEVLVYRDRDGGALRTSDGQVIEVRPGDYIIQGPNGVQMVVRREQYEKHGGLGPLIRPVAGE